MPLFNEQQKLEFINKHEGGTYRFYLFVLESCYKTEMAYDKDVCNFGHEEFKDLLQGFMATSLGSLKVKTSAIRVYIDFCIKQGYAVTENGDPNRVNIADIFDAKTLKNFVRLDAKQKKYLVNGELDNFVNFCYNAQDAIVPQLLREGVRGHDLAEIRNLRKTDIDFEKGILFLHDESKTRELSVSSKTLGLIQEALDQTVYVPHNNAKASSVNKENELFYADYIVRLIKGYGEFAPVHTNVIRTRLRRIAKQYGNHFININNLFVSGQIECGQKLMERDGIDELTTEHYKEICVRFGLAPSNAYSVKYAIEKYL
jgi:integrase